MLETISFKDYESEFSWIEKNLIEKKSARWIVPDLKTKEAFKKVLHRQYKVLPENKIMRANEYWLEIFNSQFFGYKFVSRTRIQVEAQRWLVDNHVDWSTKPGSSKYLIDFIDNYLSLIIYDQKSETLFSEWLYSNTQSITDWGLWFFMAKAFWNEIAFKKKIILSHWSSGIIEASTYLESLYKEVIFVLGSQLKGVEADIILRLKAANKIKVLIPDLKSKINYETLLWPHHKLIEFSDENTTVSSEEILNHKKEFFVFSSQVGEVKQAVSSIRSLLDSGVGPNEISVLCSDLEFYWPMISEYLKKEGVPVGKPAMSPLSSFGNISYIMSKLRLFFYKESKEDIELNCYGGDKVLDLPVADFQRLYANYYDETDFSKNKEVLEAVDRKQKDLYFQVSEIIETLLEASEDKYSTHVELIVQTLISDFEIEFKMKASEWVYYIENLITSIEVVDSKADIGGVLIDNFLATKYISSRYVFMLGLTESQIQNKHDSLISYSDVFKIYSDLGIVINLPEHSMELFELEWLLTSSKKEFKVLRAEENFDSEPLMPSLIELTHEGEALQTQPEKTRWCELQNNFKPDIPEQVPVVVQPSEVTLSATQIENYNNCPYVFMAKKLFKLSDLPDLDVDVDRMTSGLFLHELFEQLVLKKMNSLTSDLAIENLVLSMIQKLFVFEPRQKSILLSKYILIAKRFLEAEKLLQEDNPGRRVSDTELDIVGFWSIKEKDFVSQGTKEDFKFYGRADRVDVDLENNFLVVDYKSTTSGLTNYGSWLKNNKLQLALYSRALEKGLSERQYASFAGALYYVAKDFKNNKGLVVDGFSPAFNSSRSSKMTTEGWNEEFWPQVADILSSIIIKISSGSFAPLPIDKKICEPCAWRSACRASHL